MRKIQQLSATSTPNKQPAHDSDKGKNDPATKHQPDDEKSGSKSDPSKPRQPVKAEK